MVHESRDYNGRAFVPGRGPNSLGRMLPNQSSPIARHEASAKRVLPQTAEEIIETMRAEGCRRNLLDCREHFARLDKHNHGKITRRCFDAACTSLGFEWLTAADLDQLERQLTVAPGLMSYVQLARHISAGPPAPDAPSPELSSTDLNPDEWEVLDSVIKRIQTALKAQLVAPPPSCGLRPAMALRSDHSTVPVLRTAGRTPGAFVSEANKRRAFKTQNKLTIKGASERKTADFSPREEQVDGEVGFRRAEVHADAVGNYGLCPDNDRGTAPGAWFAQNVSAQPESAHPSRQTLLGYAGITMDQVAARVGQLAKVFGAADKDRSGLLAVDDFLTCLSRGGLPNNILTPDGHDQTILLKRFQRGCTSRMQSRSGKIAYVEFLEAIATGHTRPQTQQPRRVPPRPQQQSADPRMPNWIFRHVRVAGATRIELSLGKPCEPSECAAELVQVLELPAAAVVVNEQQASAKMSVSLHCGEDPQVIARVEQLHGRTLARTRIRSVTVLDYPTHENDNTKVNRLLRRIANDARTRGIELYGAFMERDSTKQGKIRKGTFGSVLSGMAGIRTSPAELQLLLDEFEAAPRNAWEDTSADLDYGRFCHAVTDADENDGGVPPPRHANRELTQWEAEELYQSLMRVKALCGQRRIDFRANLGDFDTYRNGLMARTKLKEALSVCGVKIESKEELRVLTKQYATVDGDQLDYKALCDHVESIDVPVVNPLSKGFRGPPYFR